MELNSPSPSHDRQSILLCEGDRDLRLGMALLLEMSGYEVLLAANAREAISRAFSTSLSCMILSISLPGGNSLEILRSLRGLTGSKPLPVILIAPPDFSPDVSVGFQPGRDQRLIPTFQPMDLLRAVQQAAQPVST